MGSEAVGGLVWLTQCCASGYSTSWRVLWGDVGWGTSSGDSCTDSSSCIVTIIFSSCSWVSSTVEMILYCCKTFYTYSIQGHILFSNDKYWDMYIVAN